MNQEKIVVIDDDNDICLLMDRFLRRNGFEVKTAASGTEGLQLIKDFQPDILLSDFKLGDINGAQLLEKVKNLIPSLPVIIITGYSDIKVAINVMKMGAYDYITKPLFPDEILLTIKKALKEAHKPLTKLSHSQTKLKSKAPKAKQESYIFGSSPASKDLMKQLKLVAPTSFSVIIYGESGSGKEAIAKEIHLHSKRSNKPFVAMDCGAISKELAGSELFGHEKGSFTGAITQKIGHFELANGGTLFLDEVANLSYEVQVSLLRVVQEKKVKRIGGNKEIQTDVRIIVASNERLPEAIKNGKFREDLYYRFNEFSLEVPPLRERKKDIMTFADFFLKNTNEELEKDIDDFSQEVKEHFLNYPWHGNLRELNNVVKRAALLTEGKIVKSAALPFEVVNHSKVFFVEELSASPKNKSSHSSGLKPKETNLQTAAHEAEYEMIMEVLKKVNFNKSKAARVLNIDRKTLYNKMKKMNL